MLLCNEPLGRVVDVDECMRQTPLLRNMSRQRRRPITLCGVVTAGQIGHAALTRDMGLGLRNFTGYECIGPGSNGGFKVALRATATPRYLTDSALRWFYKGYRVIERKL